MSKRNGRYYMVAAAGCENRCTSPLKRNRRYYLVAAAAVLLLLIHSCAPIYRPNTTFSPMFDGQGQFRGAGSVGNNGFNVHAGYSITDNMAITGGVIYASEIGDPGETFFAEAGAGWYFPLSIFRVEVLSGIGFGTARATGTYEFLTDRTIEARGVYGRYYLQPSFGVSIGMVDLTLASRAAWLNFFRFGETTGNGESVGNISALFMDPTVTLGIGPDNYKIFGQMGFSLPARALEFDHIPVILSIGVRFHLDP
jgi:hypothetical protein